MPADPIPPAAIEAAARAIQCAQDGSHRECTYEEMAQAALRAALPYLVQQADPRPVIEVMKCPRCYGAGEHWTTTPDHHEYTKQCGLCEGTGLAPSAAPTDRAAPAPPVAP